MELINVEDFMGQAVDGLEVLYTSGRGQGRVHSMKINKAEERAAGGVTLMKSAGLILLI